MMAGLLSLWWMWICIALVVGLIELMAPGFIFLGFALGAMVMAGVVFLAPGLSIPLMLALFAILSLVAWIVLRQVFKRQSSGARIVTRDINDH
ncbi:NfeD family protein [Sulfitobacter sp. JB4-11]|uniref:NfeD family protein n=1 Tax=Sulfitobacter rhodophyticola TaxID=3238304 RepID=UPI003D812ECC